MKIRKGIRKYVIIIDRRLDFIDRRLDFIYLTRENSEFHYSSVNSFPCWSCNFNQAKEHIKNGIKMGLTFSVVK
jgi:hypothetical protein